MRSSSTFTGTRTRAAHLSTAHRPPLTSRNFYLRTAPTASGNNPFAAPSKGLLMSSLWRTAITQCYQLLLTATLALGSDAAPASPGTLPPAKDH